MINGGPGYGKSYLGKLVIEHYRNTETKIHITATTAKACKGLDDNG